MDARLSVMRAADIPAGMKLKEVAGWNQAAADWERFLSASPEGCFVAEAEGRVVGTTTTITYEGRFAWIGMVLVEPQFRRQGVGTRLLTRAIEHLDACRVPTIKLDATPQGKPIYENLGFVTEFEIERWILERPPQAENSLSRDPPPVFGDILDLDRKVFGADRGELLRSLDRGTPAFTLGIQSEGEMRGYALGRRGSRADHFGPWMAQDEMVARELLDEFLGRSTRAVIFSDCLKANPFARKLLSSRGFKFSRSLTRMFRGPNAYPGRPDLLCAILGPEFG